MVGQSHSKRRTRVIRVGLWRPQLSRINLADDVFEFIVTRPEESFPENISERIDKHAGLIRLGVHGNLTSCYHTHLPSSFHPPFFPIHRAHRPIPTRWAPHTAAMIPDRGDRKSSLTDLLRTRLEQRADCGGRVNLWCVWSCCPAFPVL